MNRSSFIILLVVVVLAAVSLPLMALLPGELVLGGRYHITPETRLEENMNFFFAQVIVDEGAQVDGHLLLCSSTLDVGGNVTDGVRAIESDLTLRKTARVEGDIDQTDFIHWTLLLPAIAQIP